MAFDLKLVERIRPLLKGIPFVEKKMFGGVGFLIHGNMACGVLEDSLIIRVKPEKYETLLKEPHVRLFDFSGRPMKGWLVVEAKGCKTSSQLGKWVKEGTEVALTLPPK